MKSNNNKKALWHKIIRLHKLVYLPSTSSIGPRLSSLGVDAGDFWASASSSVNKFGQISTICD